MDFLTKCFETELCNVAQSLSRITPDKPGYPSTGSHYAQHKTMIG